MAKNPNHVIPASIMALADRLQVPDPDWYVASAESGRGEGAFGALERTARDLAGDNATEPEPEPVNPDQH